MSRMNHQDVQDVLRFLGTGGGLQKDFAQYTRNIEWLERQLPHLIKQHPNKWAVVFTQDEGEPACRFADDFPGVTRILDEVGVVRRTSVVQYLDPDPPVLILHALSQ